MKGSIIENKNIDINDFVSFLLKTNEEIQSTIDIEKEDKEGLSNLKIQKLIYFIEASFLLNFNKALFSSDYLAWPYGPVMPNLYENLKKFGRMPIFNEDFQTYGDYRKIKNKLLNNEMAFIKKNFIHFNKYSPFELVSLSHLLGPWREVETLHSISKKDILRFFSKKDKIWPIS